MSKKLLIISIVGCLVSFVTRGQEVLINENGGAPDASAQLEIQSTSKGVLIPRMTTAQRNAITSPATGLLVFDSSIGAFFFYSGSAWVNLSEDNLGDHTATQNIELNGNRLSGDGDNEGIAVSNAGAVTVTTATTGAGNIAVRSSGDYWTDGQGTGYYMTNANIGITGNNGNSGDIRLLTGGSPRLTIAAGGGSTFSGSLRASSTLQVDGNATFNGNAFLTGSDDYLGIGTSSPTSQLSIFGDSSNALTLWSTDNSKNHGLAFQNSGLAYTWNIYRENVGSNAADLVIRGGNQSADITTLNERFRITKDGEVGIGTNNPTSALHINAAPPGNANSGHIQIGESSSANTMMLGRTQTYGYAQTQNSEPLVFNPLGNDVGIGVTNPARHFQIHDPGATVNYMQMTHSGSGSTSTDGLLVGQSGNNSFFYNYENGHMAFRTNNSERIRIESGGDVGIGTTNPTAKLHVSGTTILGGNTTISGNNTTSGKTTTATFKVTGGSPGANKVLVSDADGDATWQNVPSRTHTISMPANMYSDAVLQSGVNFGKYSWNQRYVEFDNSATQTMTLSFMLPEDRTSNTLTIRIAYTSNAAGGNFRILTGRTPLGEGDDVTTSPGSGSATIAAPTTVNRLKVYTRTISVGSTDDYVFLVIRREGNDAADTNTGKFRVLGVAIDYEM